MKKYFNKADIIVFGITIISISIIIGYKFFWINTVPILNNADIRAEIFYTVSTSIVASGFFYLFTIFIPKCCIINTMIKEIDYYFNSIECISKIIITEICKSGTNQKYSLNDFLKYILANNNIEKNDFINHYNSKDNNKVLLESFKIQIGYIDCIIFNYSNLLPNIFIRKAYELKKLNDTEFNNNIDNQYEMFKELNLYIFYLKKYYNIKIE